MKDDIDQLCHEENHNENVIGQLGRAIKMALQEAKKRDKEMLKSLNDTIIDIATSKYTPINPEDIKGMPYDDEIRMLLKLPRMINILNPHAEKMYEEGKQLLLDNFQSYANQLRRRLK